MCELYFVSSKTNAQLVGCEFICTGNSTSLDIFIARTKQKLVQFWKVNKKTFVFKYAIIIGWIRMMSLQCRVQYYPIINVHQSKHFYKNGFGLKVAIIISYKYIEKLRLVNKHTWHCNQVEKLVYSFFLFPNVSIKLRFFIYCMIL